MMTAKQKSVKKDKITPAWTSSANSAPSVGSKKVKEKISATERWVLISRKAYGRAQRRGFVGGDPLEDLSQAIKEVDEQYATDVQGLLALTDAAEMLAQFRNLFAGYGLGQRSLERLLEMNRDAVERLAESNRRRRNGLAERMTRRKSLLQGAAGEAMRSLQGFIRDSGEEDIRFMRQPTQAIAALLSRLTDLAESAAELAAAGNGERGKGEVPVQSHEEIAIHEAVIKAYNQMSALELADAPVAALKGVSEASGRKLETAFGLRSIRHMGTSEVFEKARDVVDKADAGRRGSLEIADGSVTNLDGITRRQATVLTEVFRIRTVRDLATNRFFLSARAIVNLADCTDANH